MSINGVIGTQVRMKYKRVTKIDYYCCFGTDYNPPNVYYHLKLVSFVRLKR